MPRFRLLDLSPLLSRGLFLAGGLMLSLPMMACPASSTDRPDAADTDATPPGDGGEGDAAVCEPTLHLLAFTEAGCGANTPQRQCIGNNTCITWACSCQGKIIAGCNGFSEPWAYKLGYDGAAAPTVGADCQAGSGGGGDPAQGSSDAGPSLPACSAATRPDACPAQSAGCIADLRAVKETFLSCRSGDAWLPFVAVCGRYDGVVYAGVDSAMTYYFDRVDGHLVGYTHTGATTLPACQAFEPSFEPTACDSPAACSAGDAGP